MFDWIAANWGSIVAMVFVAAALGVSVSVLVRRRKQGRSSCGDGCGNCPMNGSCHHKT